MPEHVNNSENTETDIQSTVKRMLQDARQYYEDEFEPEASKATDYYHARAFGNERPGRSKVVSADVRDVVRGQVPSLVRVLLGPERAVEVRGETKESDTWARQATNYIYDHVFPLNNAFVQYNAAIKDALVRKIGIFKWWTDEDEQIDEAELSVSERELDALATELAEGRLEGLDVLDQTEDGSAFTVATQRLRVTKTPRFMAVPPEEFRVTPNVTNLNKAPLVAHERELPVSDLVEMGIDLEDIRRVVGAKSRPGGADSLRESRQFNRDFAPESRQITTDLSQKPVLFTEAYVRIDIHGKGISSLRLFKCIGPEYMIINGEKGEPATHVPFAVGTPDLEPHTIIGLGAADDVGDIQLIKSQIQRGMLNSLTLAIDPKQEVVESEVNLQDVISPELAGIIRVRRSGMIREIEHKFIGPEALSVLEYFDSVKEDRSGQSRAALGLDADSLQSSTKLAVAGTFSMSQQRTEMIARSLAETLVRGLFEGLLRVIAENSDGTPELVRLGGEFTKVDPSQWGPMSAVVRVEVGGMSKQEKLMALDGIRSEQEKHIMVNSPLVSFMEYRHTLDRMLQLIEEPHTELFFRPWGAREQLAMEQQKHQQAQQNPNPEAPMIAAQAELVKAQTMAEHNNQKLQADTALRVAEQERMWKEAEETRDMKRQELRQSFALRLAELELQYDKSVSEETREFMKLIDEELFRVAELAAAQQAADEPEPEVDLEVQ